MQKKKRHFVIGVAIFPTIKKGHELFLKATSDCSISQGRNAWTMPFP